MVALKEVEPGLIELTEFESKYFAESAIPAAVGEMLWREYDAKGNRLRVEFPSPSTAYQWRLTAQGWVGRVPLSSGLSLTIYPKSALKNLFRMWEYAYDLRSFQLLEGLVDAQSILEFYERLAGVLAQRVLQRSRQGFHRAYLPRAGQLPYLRGRLSGQQPLQPGRVRLTCRYDEQTADIADNQILAYTLGHIARSRRCRPQVQQQVRQAYRALQGVATPYPFGPADCQGRIYTRLSQDYQPLHALCRFFLEHAGPDHGAGDHVMLPFLVDMARLYERFVAAWLKVHLPPAWHVKVQESVHVGSNNELRFNVDLVLYDRNGRTQCVLDTKYKVADKADNADVSQIVTYAKAKGCREAVLIYPAPLQRPLDVEIGDLHVRSLTLALDADLEEAGQQFLVHLLQNRD